MFRKTGILICLLLFLSCAAARADSAIEWNGHTYKIFSDNVSWDAARERCEKAGGYLLVIDSQEEQDFICRQIMNHRGEVFWIGLTDEENEGVWMDVNGKKAEYFNWGPNEPNNGGERQNYVSIYTTVTNWSYSAASVGQWDDDFREVLFGYICEWDTPGIP